MNVDFTGPVLAVIITLGGAMISVLGAFAAAMRFLFQLREDLLQKISTISEQNAAFRLRYEQDCANLNLKLEREFVRKNTADRSA